MIEYIDRKKIGRNDLSIENYFGDLFPRVTVRASNEHWQRLLQYYQQQCNKTDPETAKHALGEIFVSSFLLPAVCSKTNFIEYQRMAMHYLKILSGFYHKFFKHCLREMSKENLPLSVKAVEEDKDFKTWATDKDPRDYTAYCLQDAFGSVMTRFRLKQFIAVHDDSDSHNIVDADDVHNIRDAQGSDSFFVTYIHEGQKWIDASSPDDIVRFWYEVHDRIALAMDMTVRWKRVLKRRNRHRIIPQGRGRFHVSLARTFLWTSGEEISEEIRENKDILLKLYPGLHNCKIKGLDSQRTFLERFTS
jgi:hypothetical protein